MRLSDSSSPPSTGGDRSEDDYIRSLADSSGIDEGDDDIDLAIDTDVSNLDSGFYGDVASQPGASDPSVKNTNADPEAGMIVKTNRRQIDDFVDDLPDTFIHSRSGPSEEKSTGGNKLRIGLIVVVAVGVVGLGWSLFFGGSKVTEEPNNVAGAVDASTTTSQTTVAVATTVEKVNPDIVGHTITTSGPGDLLTGSNLIAYYNHAYYVDKDPQKVIDSFSPATGYTVADVQDSVKGAAPGMTHEVAITYKGDNMYDVNLKLTLAGDVYDYKQTYVVSNKNGRYYIENKTDVQTG